MGGVVILFYVRLGYIRLGEITLDNFNTGYKF
jgi:hypothetical protein